MRQIRACPVCGSECRRVIGTLDITSNLRTEVNDSLLLVLCEECELIYISPILPQEVFDEIYVRNTQFDCDDYMGARASAVVEFYKGRLGAILRRIGTDGNIKVLEIGAGLAWLSRAAKSANASSITICQDITPEVSELCGWADCYLVGRLELKLTEIQRYAPYQIISLTHVIEHLPDPLETLKICNTLLDRQGIIFITSPHKPRGWNKSTPIGVWKIWSYNHVPAHLQYFNKRSLKRIADKTHLEVVYFDDSAEEGQALEAWLSRR